MFTHVFKVYAITLYFMAAPQHLKIITFKIIKKVLLRFDETNMNTLNLKQCGLCVSKLFLVVFKLFVLAKFTMMFWSFDMCVACLIFFV